MLTFKILKYPNKKLRKIAKPIIKINQYIKYIIKIMFKTMYKNNGIGLAATQININKQIIVIDLSNNKKKKIVLINPKILKISNKIISNESCLSIPKYYASIKRYKNIILNTKNLKKNIYNFKEKNLLSICIQHETDHLIGKLFIDYL